METKYLERGYRTTYKSEFDASYEGSGYIHDCVYNEEYYESGQLKYLQGKDTGYTWHENGQLKFKGYDSGKIEYNEQGIITDRAFHWKEPSVKGWGDLNYSLYVEYYRNGSIKEITFSRDEISKDKKSVAMSIHYYWKWDDKSQLINSPEKWKEELPWKRFKDIKQ